MFLVPVWHESKRFPIVTLCLVLVNIVAFLVFWPMEQRQASVVSRDQWEQQSGRLVQILLSQNSGLSESEKALVDVERQRTPFPSERLKQFFDQVQENAMSPALSAEGRFQWDATYPIFKSMERSINDNPTAVSVYYQYGFRPRGDWWPGIITHQFLHAGFFHLFFNMLFLWVVGNVLENKMTWGVLWLYLGGGIAGACAQAMQGIPTTQYMVGASAAISSLMGYALISSPRSPVKLFYLAFFFSLIPKYGVFDAPVWFFIPLWLFDQVLMAMMTTKSAASSVGYAAHLGGFAFGSLYGLVGVLLGVNSRSETIA